ncbi:uncharacterized protein LOC126988955 isoform X1 [Eriocheir sinensis]|uniref:uncharacterized protein LOC126988955 isoform X1 n=1 Tax=Eriocheir sinensis TaxID=95602 RepID=UPI0021C5F5B4|nr:uncharacterized protein LOC126988955 isoform X1 [Eriocheir sinensis]
MTQQKQVKKSWCCGCFGWLFARRKRRSPPEEPDDIVEETENAGAQADAGQQALVCLKKATQPLSVVEEEIPSDTLLDADGVVGKGEKEATGKRRQTLIITIHLVKREKVHKPVDDTTVSQKDCTQLESHGKRVQTLVITLHMVKREKIKEVYDELPSGHQGTAGDAPSSRSKAVTGPPEKMPLISSFKQRDASQTPVKKTIRFNFQNLNTFVKIRELYCAYDYCKYGFPLSSIRPELKSLKERAVEPQEEPAKEAVNKLPEAHKTVTEEATDSANKIDEPQHLTGILKKGKTASTAHKCVRFNFQNLNTFVKDRELYCGYDYFRYGFPLYSIRPELERRKERTVKPQKGPAKDAVKKHNTRHQQTVGAARCAQMNTTTEGKSPKGILKKEKMPRSTCPRHVPFNLGNLRAPVKEREVYRGHDTFRYAAPLQVTQPPNFTSRPHQQPVRSASNSLRGAPRHLERPAQRRNDSFQQNSGWYAAHNYTSSRHSQQRQHNASSHVPPRYETRHFYGGQTHRGTNSSSRSRAKRGAKPSGGEFL